MKNYIHFLFLLSSTSIAFEIRLKHNQTENSGLIDIEFESKRYAICYNYPNSSLSREFTTDLVCKKILNENATGLVYPVRIFNKTRKSLNVLCYGYETDLSECEFEVVRCFTGRVARVKCLVEGEELMNQRCKNPLLFQCESGACIYKTWVCDGKKDCVSGDDEENCVNYLNQFEKYNNTDDVSLKPQQIWRLLTLEGVNFNLKSDHIYEDHEIPTAPPCPSFADCSIQCPTERMKDINGCYICKCQDESNVNFAVKLVAGIDASEGRVEVRVNGSWGVICDDYWTIRNGHTVCKELGFMRGAKKIYKNAHFGSGNGLYFMDNVGCRGNEWSLSYCRFPGWKVHDCGEDEAAGVACDTSEIDCYDFLCDKFRCISPDRLCDGTADCLDGADEASRLCNNTVRLVDGPDHLSGRVEVFRDGVWGTICGNEWDNADAQVVCRSLGFHGPAIGVWLRTWREKYGPILLDHVYCFGIENSLEECETAATIDSSCDERKPVSVWCSHGDEVTEIPSLVKEMLPSECGNRTIVDHPNQIDGPGARIMGGMDSEYGAHPWIVGIWMIKEEDSFEDPYEGSTENSIEKTFVHSCGGTIISEFYFISAAHCFRDTTWSKYIVRAGDFNNEEPEVWEEEFKLSRVFVHEDHGKDRKYDNDIALVRIKPNNHGKGFQFSTHVGPACLPSPDTKYVPNTKCLIAGWGRMFQRPVNVLQSAVVPILSPATCAQSELYKNRRLTAGMFCAGDMAGGIDSCRGDSGGPLVCENSDRFTLFGITSWGMGPDGCGEANTPSTYVTVKHYLGWIYDRLIEDSNNPV